MPMAAADLVDVLRNGELLEADQLADTAQLQATFPDGKDLASELIRRDWLTPFQANSLLQGRGSELRLGSYTLLDRLGEGGMGTVYKARQRNLGRIVAIKVIRKDRIANVNAVKRFRREIRAAAQLDHPNIVRAFDADEIDGNHLLVMEYVENGIDLARIVKRDGPLPVAVACDYIRQAALGLQHAYERGLVHRDIKPQNLLLASKARNPNESGPLCVKILDMGLARLDHAEDDGGSSTSLTSEGMIMGTVDYMAPEQVIDSHRVDIRADLYSLGCTLYYLVTGQVPFPGGDRLGKLLRQRIQEPEAVECLRPEVPPGLAAIVRKLMAKQPEDRFQTPAEVVLALGNADKQTSAARSQETQRHPSSSGTMLDSNLAQQWAAVVTPSSETDALVKQPAILRKPPRKLNPRRWLLIAGCTLLLLFILALRPWHRGEDPPASETPAAKATPKALSAEHVAKQAERKRSAGAEEALKLIAARVATLPAGASPAGDALRQELGEFLIKYSATPAATKACELLGQVLAKLPSPLDELDPKKLPQDYLDAWQAAGREPPVELVGVLGQHRQRHWGPVKSVAYSPDGKLIASGGGDSTVRIYDAQTMKEQSALAAVNPVAGLAFARKTKRLFIGCSYPSIFRWDFEKGTELRKLKNEIATNGIRAVAISLEGRYGLCGTGDPKSLLTLWDLETGKRVCVFDGHTGTVTSVALSADGRRALSGSADKSVRVWDVERGKELQRLDGHTGEVSAVVFSPIRGHALSAGRDGTIRLWDVENQKASRVIIHGNALAGIAVSPDGRLVAGASWDRTVIVWSLESGKQLQRLEGHVGEVWSVAFSPDGRRICSGGEDGTVRLWDVTSGKEVRPLAGPTGQRNHVFFSSDDQELISCLGCWHTDIWNVMSRRRSGGFDNGVGLLASLPQNRGYLASGPDQLLKWMDARSTIRRQYGKATLNGKVSPSGERLLGIPYTGDESSLWDFETGDEIGRFPLRAATFSPDGRRIIGASSKGSLGVWDASNGRKILHLGETDGVVDAVDCSPDGQLAVFISQQVGFVWDLRIGKQVWQIDAKTPPNGAGQTVVISADNRFIAAVDPKGSVLVWGFASRKKIQEWQFPGPVHAIAFAHDGRHLATANGNGTVYILRLADGRRAP
jgi:WD40 repeat protein/serine/threonine protein kinase